MTALQKKPLGGAVNRDTERDLAAQREASARRMEAIEKVIREAVAKNPGNVAAAVDVAMKKLQARETFSDWVSSIVRERVSHIAKREHRIKFGIRFDKRPSHAPPAISYDAVREVARESVISNLLESYTICGMNLGDIPGSKLPEFAKRSKRAASKSLFNARLCSALAVLVSEDKRVSDVVSEDDAYKLFVELKGERHARKAK